MEEWLRKKDFSDHMFVNDISKQFISFFSKDIAVTIIKFCDQAYEDRLFEIFGVSYPAEINKSVKKRKAEFLAGRWCAMQCLVKFGINECVSIGKSREPIWPSGYLGAITHTSNIAAAIVAPDSGYAGLGVDIENLISKDLCDIFPQVMVPHEEVFCCSQALSNEQVCTLVFSAKESFFKAVFPRVRQYFNFHAVEVIGLTESYVRLKVVTDLCLTVPIGLEVNVSWMQVFPDVFMTHLSWGK